MPAKKATTLPYDFRVLLTHRILVLSNTLGKGAARLYAGRYGIALAEWRLLAALMIEGPSSVNDLARALAVDKGWISRSAAGLVDKGWVQTLADPADARRFLLEPTASGRALYGKILPAAVERQRRLVSVFSEEERRVLDELLARLQSEAERLNGDGDGRVTPPPRAPRAQRGRVKPVR